MADGAKASLKRNSWRTTMRSSDHIVTYTRKIKKRLRAHLGLGDKIFNLSLHRSGTQSATAFFNKIGFSSLHWPGVDFTKQCEPFLPTLDTRAVWDLYRPFVSTHNSFHDVPVPFLYREILQEYPTALFFIIGRRPASWIRSIRKHTEGRDLSVLEKFQYWTICETRRDNLAQYTDEELERAYVKFLLDVTNTMTAARANFRTFDLELAGLSCFAREVLWYYSFDSTI